MLKFFRTIRQNLLLEGKKGRYLKYAVGEIILVVIGILIALSINNWNEDRKTLKAAKVHLNNLVDAIRDDSIVYVNSLESNMFRYYSSQYLLSMADEIPYHPEADGHKVDPWKGNRIWEAPVPTEKNKEFIKLAFLWTHRIEFIAEAQSSIEELKKTEAYSYLNNKLLKDAIDAYYAQVKFRLGPKAEDVQRRIISDWQNTLMDEGILSSTPYVKGDPIELLKRNPALIGRLRGLAKQSSWSAMSFKIMTDKGAELCSLIEKEVSKM